MACLAVAMGVLSPGKRDIEGGLVVGNVFVVNDDGVDISGFRRVSERQLAEQVGQEADDPESPQLSQETNSK